MITDELKRKKITHTNILQDSNFIDDIIIWSTDICKLDPLRITEPVAEVKKLEDGCSEITIHYEVLAPNLFQKLYYKYWVRVPMEEWAKLLRSS